VRQIEIKAMARRAEVSDRRDILGDARMVTSVRWGLFPAKDFL
jgi:hypothetical protein